MSIGAVSGGGGLPLEVLSMMNQLGRELSQESRDAAREASERARTKGHEEADAMREQADEMTKGAIVGGFISAEAAGAQCAGGFMGGNTGGALKGAGAAHGQLAGPVQGIYDARAMHHQGEARHAAAEAQAANQRADSEQANGVDARKVTDRARETYSELLSLEHASLMASIGRV